MTALEVSPIEVSQQTRVVLSEGLRLAAVVVRPVGLVGDLPAVLLCHGWGGLKEQLVADYAQVFARAGFVTLSFDYRSWGESDGIIIPSQDTPQLTDGGVATVPVRIVREVVDPRSQVMDVRNCLAYLLGEEGVDPTRVGLWGTSYGGGHVVSVAGMDTRVKAVVAQIGGYGHPASEGYRDLAWRRMTEKARGLLDPPIPQGIDTYPNLRGVPDVARQFGHSPLEYAKQVRVPTMVIDAEFEEYNTPDLQGGAAYDIIRANAVAERHTFPCTHYAVYDTYLEPARKLALGWFLRHL